MRPLNPGGFHVNVNDETSNTVESSDVSPEIPYIWIILSIIRLLIEMK